MSKKIMEVSCATVTVIKSNPVQISIDCIGKVPSTGWKNPRLDPRFYTGGSPSDGVQDFDFVADAPSGIVLWVISPIKVSLILQGVSTSIKGIRVHSDTNDKEVMFDKSNVIII